MALLRCSLPAQGIVSPSTLIPPRKRSNILNTIMAQSSSLMCSRFSLIPYPLVDSSSNPIRMIALTVSAVLLSKYHLVNTCWARTMQEFTCILNTQTVIENHQFLQGSTLFWYKSTRNHGDTGASMVSILYLVWNCSPSHHCKGFVQLKCASSSNSCRI